MWKLESTKKIPVYQQIMEQIIEYIQKGQLNPGDHLPSERKLAASYQVNRSTVVHALEELVSLGWIIRQQGSGTLVNEGRWGRSATPRMNWRQLLSRETPQTEPYLLELHEIQKDTQTLDLYTGELPLDLIPDFRLPAYTWEELLIEEKKQRDLGYPPLQRIICERLYREQGLEAATNQVLITSGAQQALFLLLQVMLEAGDSVAIEDPSFLYSLPIFDTAGVRLYGVAMDEEGMQIEALEQLILAKRVKLIIVNPTFQNPTGNTMTLKRRKQLIALSEKYQLPIVEDDVFSELNFLQLPPSLKSLAPHQVIHLGSLSKIFGSSIKIGWIVADQSLIQRLSEAKQMMDFSISVFPQVVAYTALTDQSFETNRQELIDTLKHKRDCFYSCAQSVSSDWQFEEIDGGLYVWLKWRHQKLTRKDWGLFLQEKLLVAPSFLFSNDTMAMRVNYSRMTEEECYIFFVKLQKISEIIGGRKYERDN
ncbi:PLP-dependent aminotransferase family protein [Candidatus Enterococcus ferrettii]|uniref:HTH gntR-type domain-containing protein n=1 Tax=Candidatus Enterococcus ferrettii TaxID=2815324 RepID=A0ABV0ETF8_9ENTE|nr:PLP-dependent aminotransferase family protein [Enterococcus sp. 665A]MBO1340994.1 PLP-dependent aminotransferase family protein [Enterococcus sp. 665A]